MANAVVAQLSAKPTVEERFWAKVDRSGECWLWTAATSRGYGRFVMQGSLRLAHRVAWRIVRGSDPSADMVLDHVCRVRSCVNPDHLREVTMAENVRVGAKAKLSDSSAGSLRREYAAGDVTFRELGERYGVSTSTAGYAATGRTWAGV